MNTIGSKIKKVRKSKGFSQEELAELAKVNLRTIQRIENNQSDPRGTTLKLICEALSINIEEVIDFGKETDKKYLLFFHLSVLSFIAIPVGNIIIPLILWLTKKDKISGLKETGVNVINYQITWSIITFSLIGLSLFCKFMHYPYTSVLLSIVIILYAINLILPITYALQLRFGNIIPKYPSLIKIVR